MSKITMFVRTRAGLQPHARTSPTAPARNRAFSMILIQPPGRFLQRDQSCSRQHTRLPHPAAQALAVEPALAPLLRRCPPAAIPPARPIPSRGKTSPCPHRARSAPPARPSRHCRIKHPCAVHVYFQAPRRAPRRRSHRAPRARYTVPPPMLCVFSSEITLVGALCGPHARSSLSMLAQLKIPSAVATERTRHPENHASIESSQSRMCDRASQITSSP